MIVYVAGYPKSGTTWITRLLGDALNCKTGGCMPSEDALEIVTEGYRRNSNITIRKGHFVLTNDVTTIPVIKAHRLNWKALKTMEHKVVFVVRDPRDIAVSGAYHWRISIREFISNMIKGANGLRRIGPLCAYMKPWLEKYERLKVQVVRYEDMLDDSQPLARILDEFEFDVTAKRIYEAYDRQSFVNRRNDVIKRGHAYNRGKEFNLRFMRKGIVGDWRNILLVRKRLKPKLISETY